MRLYVWNMIRIQVLAVHSYKGRIVDMEKQETKTNSPIARDGVSEHQHGGVSKGGVYVMRRKEMWSRNKTVTPWEHTWVCQNHTIHRSLQCAAYNWCAVQRTHSSASHLYELSTLRYGARPDWLSTCFSCPLGCAIFHTCKSRTTPTKLQTSSRFLPTFAHTHSLTRHISPTWLRNDHAQTNGYRAPRATIADAVASYLASSSRTMLATSSAGMSAAGVTCWPRNNPCELERNPHLSLTKMMR